MSSSTPTRVCVIGAGTMGSGIAAHLANLGFTVTLLDQTVEGARAALDRARSLRPPHFYDPIIADSVRIGSVAENLAWVAESDWVCEAIYENMDAKRSLYQSIEAVLPESCYISTNTSGLEIRDLVEGRSDAFKKKFIGTHFFNPPRYLKLLELIPTEFTDPAITLAFTRLMEDSVGRRVVVAKDTPGFIANRYGMWCMFHATHVAEKLRLSPEQVDAITGPFLGRPRTGSFRLNDLVGMDIMLDIANNLFQRCAEDPHRDVLKAPKSLQFLFDKGHLGTKSGMGYYRKEGRELLTFDLETQAYRQQQDPNLPSLVTLGKLPLGERIRQALLLKDEVGEFMRLYLPAALRYADYLKEEISFNVEDFDRVMMWGFGWETGPFGLVDAIGADNLGWDKKPFYEGATMRDFSGNYVARKVQPEFADIKSFPVLETRTGFCIRDLGADVKAISLTSKMGTISTDLCLDLIDWLQPQVGCLVFTSEARHFSLGFDLTIFEKAISEGNPDEIERGILALQEAASLLATKRVVAAVHGYCLGGGLELVMPCAQVISHSEAQIGLPEIRVGLLPGGAGNVVLRQRGSQTVKDIIAMAKSIMTGAVSTNAYQAKTLGYLRSSDVIATHPDRILYDAKHLALKVEVQPQPVWNTPSGPIIGMVDQLIADLEKTQDWATYDLQVAESIKHVFTKSTSAEDARHREREEFLRLCRNGMTYERIKHMLENGKPLRN